MLASCAVAPATTPVLEDQSDPSTLAHHTAPPADLDLMPLRLGIEYLPPSKKTDDFATAEGFSDQDPPPSVRVEGRFRPTPVTVHEKEPDPLDEEPSPWNLRRRDLERIEDPIERHTMLFVHDLVGEDRRRMRRELMTPLLTNRLHYSADDPLRRIYDDEQRLDDEARFLSETAPGVLRRPMQKLLKRVTFIEDFELALDEFKAENIPLSGAYRKRNGDSRNWGRVSMRIRLSDGSDPMELSYYNWGFRFGSSKERGRIQYRARLADGVDGNIRYRFDYETHDTSIRADVRYIVNEQTEVYLVAGDKLDFLDGPTAYSFVNSPLDGTPGVLFYVQHDF